MKLTYGFKKAYKRALITLSAAVVTTAAVLGVMSFANQNVVKASSAAECGSTAIINCGASTNTQLIQKYDENASGDLPQVYGAFGISSAMVHSLADKVELGAVHKDGTVWIGSQQIGTGAITAGRVNYAGSNPLKDQSGNVIPNVYSRPPSVSFAVNSIDAYIGFIDGKPSFAILSACGNPVTWPMPNITIAKQVSTPDYTSWVKDATYTNNSTVKYLITVKNIGQAAATNVIIYDKLPAYQTYEAGSTKINSTANVDGVTQNGINVGSIAPNTVVFLTFRATVAVPADKCGVTDMRNIAHEDNDQQGWREDSATTHVNITCVQPKVVKCNSLDGPTSIQLGQTASYTAVASDESLVQSYDFTINGAPVNVGSGKNISYTPTVAGTYTIAVKVTPKAGVTDGGSTGCMKTLTVTEKPAPKMVSCVSLNGPDTANIGDSLVYTATTSDATLVDNYSFTYDGATIPANGNMTTVKVTSAGLHTVAAKVTPKAGVTDGGSDKCVKTYTVKEVPKPIYTCDALAVTPTTVLAGGNVTAKLSYTAKNGATFKSATFNFGDGGSNPVVTNANDVSATYTYAKAGTYSVTIPTLTFTVNGQDVVVTNPANCTGKVTVTEKPQVVTNCDALSASNLNLNLGDTTTLTAQATAMNTTVTSYEFTVNGQTVQNTSASSFAYKPAAAGNYIVAVKVHFANGDVKGGTGSCAKTVCVTEVATPIYSCDLLSLSATTIKNGDKVTATVKYTAKNGATFQSAVVNFGEDSVKVAAGNNGMFTADYTYKTAKDYAVTATLTFMVNGKAVDVTSTGCASKVTTVPTPPVEKCKIPGKEQYAANDTVNCNAVKGVTTLPNTGAGNMIGLFAAVTAAGAILHNVWMRRFGSR